MRLFIDLCVSLHTRKGARVRRQIGWWSLAVVFFGGSTPYRWV